MKQGGSRRGLPQSFLNRFTQVYINSLNDIDLTCILSTTFPTFPKPTISQLINFNAAIISELQQNTFAHKGSPWEFNLRDLTRLCEALQHASTEYPNYPIDNLIELVYCDRLRTPGDRSKIRDIFETVFGRKFAGTSPVVHVNQSKVWLGDVSLKRETYGVNMNVLKQDNQTLVLRSQLHVLRSLAYCVNLNWMAILVSDFSGV